MSDIFKTTTDVNSQSASMNYSNSYDTNTGKFDTKSLWQQVWNASTDSLQKSLGIFTGGSKQEVQAISQGVAEGTIQSVDNIKQITKYIAITGLVVIAILLYTKLK